jgi:hypothetical protein
MKERDSNIELLRIVATFFILIVHCNGWFLQEWGEIDTWSAGRGVLVGLARTTIQSVACIGVNLFILISGFYAIKPKMKSILNLFSILIFFYVGTYILTVLIGDTLFTWEHLIKNFCAFSRQNWFIQCYLFLLLLSPILNAFIEKCTKQSLLKYIGVFLLCSFYFGNIHESTYFYFNNGYSVTTFILIYLIGRYLKLYGMKYFESVHKIRILIFYLVSLFPIIAILLFSNDSVRWLGYNSPLLMISSVLLFVFFAKLSLRNRFVNWVGTSCLSVYILHTCAPFMGWFVEYDIHIFNNYPYISYFGLMLLGCLIVFIISILLDKIRQLIASPIIGLTDKIKSRHYGD